MSSTLLKLYNSSGDLDVMTTAEEYYVAYQAAVWLATNMTTGNPGSIAVGTAVSPERAVGSYVNTYYNQAVGTHPGSSLSTGSTTTTFKQNNSASFDPATDAGSNWRRPATWDTTNSGIKELTDAEMNTVCDRLLAYMMANEWSGVNFRLATSAPAGYSSFLANVFTDTQSSGVTAATYSIYKKTTTPTAPSAARPICLKRASYPSGAYQGIQQMSDAQIGATFGAWIKSRMVNADDTVGRYLLTTSTPSGLGYSGTWQSRGSATDTRDTTSEVDYSAVYSAAYSRNRLETFTGNFVGDYVGTREYSGVYSANYTTTFTGNFVGDYLGTREYSANYTRIRATTYTRIRTQNFTRSRKTPIYQGYAYYIGNFIAYYTGNYVGNFTGDFVGNYILNANFTRTRVTDYVGDFVGNYTGNYILNANFTRTRVTDYVGDFIGNYTGNYTGNYIGTTLTSSDATINTYTLYTRVA